MGSVIAELRVSGPSAILTEDALRELPEADVRIQYQGTSEKAGLVVQDCDFDDFEAAIQSDPSIGSYECVADFSDVRVYNITAGSVSTLVSEFFADRDIQILKATSPPGDSKWRLRTRCPSRENLSEVIAECRDADNTVQLDTLYSEGNSSETDVSGCPAMTRLTDEQYDALVKAHEMGYFEIPRDTSLTQLSDTFDIGSQAMSERLRRGVNTLIGAHIQRGQGTAEAKN
ncbi:DNA binding domain-containing protein [Haloferax mucosum ATCC BAA-1512]|uniref:DNA binding domain-containing protein n=2 Tax=Haloferax mucosum TaxID=403181 RepID=M0I374_9EURY|nr:DNA binding domain-containing protein [Haloferax mucosum ATCC BAA-1512]